MLGKSLLVTVLLSTGLAMAEEPAANNNVIDKRQENQEKRIEQGEQSGQLTKHEEKRLERRQKRIEQMEKRAEADGTVTPKEKARIERAQNRASREIFRAKHNGRTHK